MDTSHGASKSRLQGMLPSISPEGAAIFASTGIYERIAAAFTGGMLPYVDGRDKILQDQINELKARCAALEQRSSALEQRASRAEARISTLENQMAQVMGLSGQIDALWGTISSLESQIAAASG